MLSGSPQWARRVGIVLAVLLLVTACSYTVKPGRALPRLPASYLPPASLLCEWVPKAAALSATGLPDLTGTGRAPTDPQHLDAYCGMNPPTTTGAAGTQAEIGYCPCPQAAVDLIKDTIAHPGNDVLVFPASMGIGYAKPLTGSGAAGSLLRGQVIITFSSFTLAAGTDPRLSVQRFIQALIVAFDLPT